MINHVTRNTLVLLCLTLCLVACSTKPFSPVSETSVPIAAVRSQDEYRINELERLLAEKQKQCLEEKKRQDVVLKENQKKIDELQWKLNNLLAIDRELRSKKGR